MNKNVFDSFVNKILKKKAMTSSDIKDAILKEYPNENKNTIKSMILRSKLLKSSYPSTFNKGCYAYTLKTNRNYKELFLKLSNNDIDTIAFIRSVLNERSSFISLFSFKKLLQINVGNQGLIDAKINALRFYKETITVNGDFIYPVQYMQFYDQESDFFNKQKIRLLAAKILLFKHNSENIIQIKKANYLGMTNDLFRFPKPLFNIYFDAYANAPSYVNDLSKSSYVVYDFAINDCYSVVECKSFINRILKLKAYGVAVIPICVFKTTKPEVKELIRSSGIIEIKYSSFLGKEYEDILRDLNTICEDNDLNFSDKQLEKLINSLCQIDLLEQTKGYLFEYICYRFLNDYYGVKPTRNVIIPKNENNPGAQFDIIISQGEETIVCECKATTAGIGFGSLAKANKYTVAHTISKIELLNKPNKKMLYFVTSFYKKISEENMKSLSLLTPRKTPIKNKCFYSFKELITAFPKNKWLKIWNNYVQNK